MIRLTDWREPDFPRMEQAVAAFWDEQRIFERSVEQRRGGPTFVFYDGPPFATGLPHYGHLLAGTIKDVVPRYQAMRGAYVERRFGWDCHGLPVEYEVEQDLKISGKREIEALGVDVFNERCRAIVLRYTREWREIVTRMGRWVDFDHDYKTMDPPYMESIWWVFQTLWNKGLIYEGNKILPYCSRCATPLSNFETNQGYQDTQDPAITVRLRLVDDPATCLLVWTTTPWTLPSNMGVAVGRHIPYVRVREGDTSYILAASRVPVYFKKTDALAVEPVEAGELVGLRYQPLFDCFADRAQSGAFRVVEADFVGADDGTGLVHLAPGFGEDDYRVGREQGIPAVCPVDEEGRFTDEVPRYAGREVKAADSDIIRQLKQEGALVHQSTLVHSYPHCWRCDQPLIYRAVSTWFMKVEAIRDRLTELNRQVHWMPDHLRDGRFGKWLEQARDWAISRNRYWGAPLPLWRSEDGAETVCIGSIAELEQRSGVKVDDLHKHYVDAIEIPSAEGRGPLRRVPEVLDCWFESGAMPYAQNHYPFENKEWFEQHYPADFIAEGLDQTRGWFYTLAVLAAALFDRPAYRNVIVNGLVLAEDGRKMSKRLKNYPDPKTMIDTYGADAIRLYMMHSPVVRAEALRFSEHGVRDILRHILLPLWNACSFFSTYAAIDEWTPPADAQQAAAESDNVLDRWILEALAGLVKDVTEAMDAYDLQRAVRPFVGFIDDLTNWYIRRSRRRFWKSRNDTDKAGAYATLYSVLKQVSLIGAPFLPFFSEAMYQGLKTDDDPASVHLCDYPSSAGVDPDPTLDAHMHAVMTVVRLGRLLRSEHNLKVRQPLSQLDVVTRDETLLNGLDALQALIADELNVKTVAFRRDESGLTTLSVKPDFRRLGPRLGPRVKQAAGCLARLPQEQIETLLSGQPLTLTVDGQTLTISAEDVVVEHHPASDVVVAVEGGLVVALHTQVTGGLAAEGIARELVHHIQNLRKTMDLPVAARIDVRVHADPEVRQAVTDHADYVCAEVLADSMDWLDAPGAGDTACDLNGRACALRIVAR